MVLLAWKRIKEAAILRLECMVIIRTRKSCQERAGRAEKLVPLLSSETRLKIIEMSFDCSPALSFAAPYQTQAIPAGPKKGTFAENCADWKDLAAARPAKRSSWHEEASSDVTKWTPNLRSERVDRSSSSIYSW